MSARAFDVVVLGAGPAGEVVAGRLADGGLEVALLEQELVGGECSFWACMPSKALLRPSEALAEIRRVPGAAEAVTGELDVAATLARRDEVIHDLDDSAQLPWLKERGVTLIREHGTITGERRVQAGDDELEARRAVVLACGSSAAMPPIEGLMDSRPWTSREVTTAKRAPECLVIIGGGIVGVEMAQAWKSLGSKVILIEGARRLLANEEEFACEQVTDALVEIGVDVRTGLKATKVSRPDPGGEVTVTTDDGGTASGDELLMALGRHPNTDDIGLEMLGLEAGKVVEVDDHLRTPGHPWLYAIGDVNGRVLLTHMGKYQARQAADHILGRADARIDPLSDGRLSPRVVFTDPQMAAVGHTSKTAQEAGLNVRCVDVGTSTNAGGSFTGRGTSGSARIVVDEDRGVIVGATITGPEVAEFLHAATIAVVCEVPLRRLWHAVPSFPTRSELWLRLLEEYGL